MIGIRNLTQMPSADPIAWDYVKDSAPWLPKASKGYKGGKGYGKEGGKAKGSGYQNRQTEHGWKDWSKSASWGSQQQQHTSSGSQEKWG